MVNKKKSKDYRNISGYIPVSLFNHVKDVITKSGLDQNVIIEEALRDWLGVKEKTNPPKDIHQIVQENFDILLDNGFPESKLKNIAQGEVLPTPIDFSAIVGTLKLPEEQARQVWHTTYRKLNDDYESIRSTQEL